MILHSLAFALLGSAQPPIALEQYDDRLVGERTEIVVLGTAHLSSFRDEVDRATLDAMLDPLLDRLEARKPEVIAIEAVSGPDCDHLLRYGEAFAGGSGYCRVDAAAQSFIGLTAPQAETKILEIMLAGGPKDKASARRSLAALFMAAGDSNSALVQWLRLAPEDRVPGKELSQEMADALATSANSLNENVSIGVALAVRLGHERVWPVDDHSADQIQLAKAEHYGKHMRAIWAQNIDQADEKRDAALAALKASGDLMAYYRFLNAPENQDLTIRNDFALALADDRKERVGQTYANWWQVRNLRMTANIVAAAAMEDATEVLAIVGASHAPYYADYLERMHHVDVVDTMEILAE